jgi:hypothetical protein
MDDSIVSDEQWQRWADELSALQREHPGDIGFYDKEFADWDGSTGMHLPHDEWTREKALQVRNVWARTLRPGATDSTPPAPQIAAPAAIAAPLPAQASLF